MDPINSINTNKRKLTREQIQAIKKAKRRKRLISTAFLIVAVLVFLTLLFWLASAFLPKDITNKLFPTKETTDNQVVYYTTAPEEETVDKTTYVKVPLDDIHRGTLLLVNRKNEYLFSDPESEFVPVSSLCSADYTAKDNNVVLQKVAIEAMNRWMAGFRQASGQTDIIVYSGFRSAAEQQSTIDYYLGLRGKSYVDKYVSPVGFSEHHTGLALDIDIKTDTGISTFYGTDTYAWVTEHAPDYGFILRYTEEKKSVTGYNYESWHFRYVGVPHALAMKEKDYCLEEYIDYVTLFSYDTEHIKVTDTAETPYEIYYYKAVGDGEQEVPVPPDAAGYEIEGDNVQGYIVTVQMPKTVA